MTKFLILCACLPFGAKAGGYTTCSSRDESCQGKVIADDIQLLQGRIKVSQDHVEDVAVTDQAAKDSNDIAGGSVKASDVHSHGKTNVSQATTQACGGRDSGCSNIVEGDGDCNSDSDCAAGLKCGSDNCGDFRSSAGWPRVFSGGWDTTDDCCYKEASTLSGTNDPNAKNLVACIGECDSDKQCVNGLKCFQRTGTPGVPGCSGSGKTDWDYCYNPSGSLELSGGNINGATNLSACRGECDNDSECAAGLKCFQRSYGETIPGCTDVGAGKDDWDYCYDPGWSSKASAYTNLGPGFCQDSGNQRTMSYQNLGLSYAICRAHCDSDAECQGYTHSSQGAVQNSGICIIYVKAASKGNQYSRGWKLISESTNPIARAGGNAGGGSCYAKA